MQKVLIVSAEDLRDDLSRTILGQAEVEYQLATDAEAGFRAAQQRPRLVIVALRDQEATVAFIQRVRQDPEARDASVLAVRESALPAEVEALRRAGAGAVVPRRVDPFLWNDPLERLLSIAARREASIPVRFWVWYRLPSDEKPIRGRAVNIGARGMLIEAPAVDIEHGTQVEAEFSFPGSETPLRAVARVVREAGHGGDGRRRFGIEFINLSPEARDRIEAFVSAAGLGRSGRLS